VQDAESGEDGLVVFPAVGDREEVGSAVALPFEGLTLIAANDAVNLYLESFFRCVKDAFGIDELLCSAISIWRQMNS
jgi:hypothetical protein